MLIKFLNSNTEIEYNLIRAYQNFQQDEILKHVNYIKGASAYIFASRVYYCCFFIDHLQESNEYAIQWDYYQTLIEQIVEL